MALNFPDPATQTPVNTFSPTSTPDASTNGITYLWDGQKWNAQGSGDAAFWQRTGTTLSPVTAGDNILTIGDLRVNDAEVDTLTSNGLVSAPGIQTAMLNGGPLAGLRNHLQNPCFEIWQRGISSTASGGRFTADRWHASSTASNTISRQAGPATLGINASIQFGANSSGLRQGIELYLNATPAGQAGPYVPGSTWTLSCYSTMDMTGFAPVIAFRDSVSSTANQQVLDSTTDNWASTGETDGTFTRYSTTITVDAGVAPVASNRCLGIVIIPDAQAIAANTRVTGCQFESGPVCTPLEQRPMSVELSLCQRYFYKLDNGGGNNGLFMVTFMSGSGLRSGCIVPLPAPMRAMPTVTNLDVRNNPTAYISPANTGNNDCIVIASDDDNSGSNQMPTVRRFDASADF